jgi:hypothetical protein
MYTHLLAEIYSNIEYCCYRRSRRVILYVWGREGEREGRWVVVGVGEEGSRRTLKIE